MQRGQKSMIFSTQTSMGRDQNTKIQQLLMSLLNSSDSLVFRQPVNWQGLNLMDYPVIIKKPMDLLTVKRKIANSNYQYVQDCLQEINVIWENAKVYNPKQNEIHKLADKLEKQTRKMIKNYLPFVRIENVQVKKKAGQAKKQTVKQTKQAETTKPKTYLEKQEEAKNQQQQNMEPEQPQNVIVRKNLLYMVQLCNKQQLGVLFQMIYKNCEKAIEFDEQGSVTIRAEDIDDALVKRLSSLLQMWGLGFKTTNNKKK